MATFTLADESFDLVTADDITFAEARAFEKAAGFPFADVVAGGEPARTTAAFQAMVWISMKRVRPEMKFTDLDDLRWDSVDFVADEPGDSTEGGPEESPDPTPAEV